ncbi:unnamed protein product [Cyprideis torosa]|uniref:Uncharacterized protein n=1 Tax=Cyprideis torosa TaxID=163714 RepID=A0A7R8WDF7_9CRUS|nr:unnamed protein product [Cyprideis torosa]CAG0893109.1 unnamed protein product [Cyprideis torosa]
MAEQKKTEGNALFKSRNFEQAILKYTEGLECCPQDDKDTLALLHQNRAAAYEAVGEMERCLQDCDDALAANNRYVKALVRRSRVLEKQGDLLGALRDLTLSSFLGQNFCMDSFQRAQLLLMKLSSERAALFLCAREPVMPSNSFIKSFFALFTQDPMVNWNGTNCTETTAAAGDTSRDDASFVQACRLYRENRFKEIIGVLNEVVARGSGEPYYFEALSSRAIFHLLRGDTQRALEDLNEVIKEPTITPELRSNALIKRATVYLFNDNFNESRQALDEAVSCCPKNPDALLHRGQLSVFQERFSDAVNDFDAAKDCGGEESVSEMQKAFSQVRMKMREGTTAMKSAIDQLIECCEKYPDRPDALVLCAQSLNVQGQKQKAAELFRKSLELDPENVGIEVHLRILEGDLNQDVEGTIEKLEALGQKDPTCQLVFETLGPMYLRQGEVKKALGAFDRALVVAYNQKEVKQLLMLKTMTEVHLMISEQYPDLAKLPLQFLPQQ